MTKQTTIENFGKFGILNNQVYESKIGFDKEDNSVPKWYKVTGHRSATIFTLYKEGKRVIFGKEVVDINEK